jgi:hypothetical protein
MQVLMHVSVERRKLSGKLRSCVSMVSLLWYSLRVDHCVNPNHPDFLEYQQLYFFTINGKSKPPPPLIGKLR